MTPPNKLHTVAQIAGATFLGGPLAGAWLMARNDRALGHADEARKTVIWGLVATAALVALVLVLPEGTPNGVIPVAYTVVMGQIAHKTQGAQIAAHLEGGGSKGSPWLAAGVGALCLVLFMVAAITAFVLMPEDRLDYLGSAVYWEDGATEDQARLVGDYMVDIGVFAPENSLDIHLAQPDGTLQLKFVVLDHGWEDPDTVASFQNLAHLVSAGALEGAPAEVWMCDDFLMPRKKLHSSD